VAFRPPLPNEKPPRCLRCRKSNPHTVTRPSGAVQWLCTACEYEERFPNAPIIPAAPNARRARPLQTEVLFTD
jgi:hypothetical protein